MANNYELGTISPYFPTRIVKQFEGDLPAGVDQDEMPDGFTYLFVEDGCEDWDQLAETLQKMLIEWQNSKELDPPRYCYYKACYYCDKMRQDEFGGFGCFITADDLHYIGLDAEIMEKIRKLETGEVM